MLYLHHVGALAGAEGSLLLLLGHLDRGTVEPCFAGPADGVFPDEVRRLGVPAFPVEFGRLRDVRALLVAAARVRAIARARRVDLLHSNAPNTNVCAGLAGAVSRLPVVWHARNLIHGRMWDVDRILAPLATRIICNTDAIRERFRGSRAFPRTVTIVNAVDAREFHPGVPREPFRNELGLAPDEVAVGLVGRIGLGKGHDVFVDAARALLDAGVRARFVVVGAAVFDEDGWRADALQRRVKDAGREASIVFTGFRRDIPGVMRGLDVAVLASDAEPCGRVLFEAMASATPIVATGTGGTPEIVRDGREGLLVPPRDPAALARAIGRLIDDPALRERLGAAGLARARAEFAVERYVSRTVEVYRDAIAAR